MPGMFIMVRDDELHMEFVSSGVELTGYTPFDFISNQ